MEAIELLRRLVMEQEPVVTGLLLAVTSTW